MKIVRIILGTLALALWFIACPPAFAQSALDFAASGMGRQEAAHALRHARVSRRLMRRVARHESRVGRPLDIRTTPQLLAMADRYIGSRRFTRQARAWCADAMNAWLARIGKRGTGDGRAISFAHYGRATSPHPGAIAVMRHHVGVVAKVERGGVVLVSGNHAHRVGVGFYSRRVILAFREP